MARARRQPPWWPEGEPWPPYRRRNFARWAIRRVFFAGAVIFGAFAILNVVLWQAVGGHWGEGPPPFVAVFFAFIIVAIVFGTLRAARQIGRPAGDILDSVDRLAEGDYAVRVRGGGSREMREVGASFNRLAERLGALEAQRQNLVADASHELRTPLSVIRGNLEGIADGVYEPQHGRIQLLLDEVGVIARLVDDLQTLSQAEAGALRLHPEPSDLGALIHGVVAAWQDRAAARSVVLIAEVAERAPFSFDAVRIREVLENLVANALRHTPEGGSVTVRLTWPFAAAEIEVEDTGSGIPAAELPLVFERFRKGADSRGQGLGLAIAKRLVEAHGGQIRVKSTGTGGTVFLVRLPVHI
jgi:two-component system sensor histidine kinase BaeS